MNIADLEIENRNKTIEDVLYRDLLTLDFIAPEIHYLLSTDSTMNIARDLVKNESVIDGTVIIAEHQTNGRGRFNREWFSPNGGIYLSIITYNADNEHTTLLPHVAGIASCEAIREYLPKASIKWVNDIIYNNKKLCGILVEGKHGYDVIGIGIDTNLAEFPDELKDISTSFFLETGKEVDNLEFIKKLLTKFDEIYKIFKKESYKDIIDKYKELTLLNKNVRILNGNGNYFFAKTVDVDETGALIVKCKDAGLKRIIEGEIKYIL